MIFSSDWVLLSLDRLQSSKTLLDTLKLMWCKSYSFFWKNFYYWFLEYKLFMKMCRRICHFKNCTSLTRWILVMFTRTLFSSEFNWFVHWRLYYILKFSYLIFMLFFPRFSLLLLEPSEIYFEDFSVFYYPPGLSDEEAESK